MGYNPRSRPEMAEITSFADAARVVYRGSRGIEILPGPENHGHLRGIHIEHVLLNRKCSTKKIGMTSPNSRTYEVPEFAGTEFNRRSGNLKGLTGYLHKHFTKKVAGIAGRQQHHMNNISANIRAPRRCKQPTCKCCSYITPIHQYPPSRSRSVAET